MPLGIINTQVAVPGTVLLRDDEGLAGAARLKHARGKKGSVVLVPQPSSDPNDPLNWPRWKKDFVFGVFFVSSIVLAAVPAPMISSATVILSKVLGKSLDDISELSGDQLLVVGCLGPIVSALASKYGKRPQFVFAAVMALIGCAICIGAHENYDILLAGRLVQGFGTTAFESLSLSALGDIYFVHERPLRTGVLILSVTCISSLAAIIGGPITSHLGWRYLFIIHLPFVIVCTVGIVLFVPETQFNREGSALPTSPQDVDHVDVPKNANRTPSSAIEDSKLEASNSSPTVKRKGILQEMSLYNGTFSDESLLKLIVVPLLTAFNPIVIWALLVSAVVPAFYVSTAYIMAQLWSAPPYLLNASGVGYFFTGGLIGGVLGCLSGAYICNITTNYLVRLNHGTNEPEFRIPPQIITALCIGLGWFVWMWQVSHPTPTGYYLGSFCYGTVCFGFSLTAVSATLYILDTYRTSSNEIFIFLMLAKNLLFYGFSTFINSWTAEVGAAHVFKVFGIVSLVLIATSIPMYVFGKIARRSPLIGLSERKLLS